MTQTFSGRAIVGGLIIKFVAFVLTLIVGASPWLELIDTFGDLAVIVGALIIIVLLFADMKQRLLWRIRRKLAVSYIFIGFIPALLIIVFFLVAGLLLFFNIGSFMMRNELQRFVERARLAAESIALDVERTRSAADVRNAIEVRRNVLKRYAGTSGAFVPSDGRCGPVAAAVAEVTVGPWMHLPAPTAIPKWVPCTGYSGLIAYTEGETTRLLARAVVWPASGQGAVVLDVPVDEGFHRELLDHAGLTILYVGFYDENSFLDPDSVERKNRPKAI